MLKDFILRNWWVQNHCTYIFLGPCTFKSFKLHSNTLSQMVYLNVVVHIVTVSNFVPATTINCGSSMLLTFEIMSWVKGISFCREMPKSSWGIPFMHLQVTVAELFMLYINKLYLFVRDAKLVLRDSIYNKLYLNTVYLFLRVAKLLMTDNFDLQI